MQVQEVTGERARLVTTGYDVHLANNCYVRTNHFIKCSQPFCKNAGKLRQFWRFPYMRTLFFLHFLFVIPCFFLWMYACMAFFFSILWVLFFLQHMIVLLFTLPKVLKQPVLSNTAQRSLNEFYEFTQETINGVFLTAQMEGIGCVMGRREEQSIRFQAFNERGYQIMVNAKHCSRVMFVISLILLLWSLSWALAETAVPFIVKNMNMTVPCGFMFSLPC